MSNYFRDCVNDEDAGRVEGFCRAVVYIKISPRKEN